MPKIRQASVSILLLCVFLWLIPSGRVNADGTETLGPPSIPLATGSGILAAGTGLADGEGIIDLTIPENYTVKQVLLYWEGQMVGNVPGDNTARLNGSTIVTGALIGGPTKFFGNFFSSAYRVDITNLNLIQPGYNELLVDDVNYTRIANGAGIMVIFEDETGPAVVDLRDGLDIAYHGFPEPRQTTIAQTYTFPPSPVDRVATLSLFASSVAGEISGGMRRPESLEVTVAGQTTLFSNELNSWDGEEWDTKANSVIIPAGATQLTVQIFSRDDLNTGNDPSSLTWIAGGLTIRAPAPGLEIEKWTNGADADDANGTDVPVIGPGAVVTWTYRVTNIGMLPFLETEIQVTDDIVGPVTTLIEKLGNMDEVLGPGETWIYQATGSALDLATNPGGVTIVQGCGLGQTNPTIPTYKNIGTVVGVPTTGGDPITDSDPSHYCNEQPPAIDIEKATNGEDADTPTGPLILMGDPVNWTYVVTNIGSDTLTNVTVTDNQGVAVSCPLTVLEPGQSMTCTATGVATVGQYANIGSVVGTPTSGGPPVTDEDPSHYFGYTPAIVIEKATNGEDADTPTGPLVPIGDAVTWTYVVTNTGTVTLTNVTVTDNQGVSVSCPQTVLAPGGSMTCTATGVAVAGQYANIGSVIGTPSTGGNPVTDDDPSHYVGYEPAIVIEKATNGEDADTPTGPFVPIGGAVTWTYVVTNTSSVTLNNVTVTDNQGVSVSCPQTVLAPGESMTCTATGVAVAGQYANIGTVIGTPVTGGDPVTDDDPSHYFGYEPASVGNFVFGDIDPNGTTPEEIAAGNGLQDAGEQGIDGIIVELHASDGTLISTTVTAGGGFYLFDNLAPGDYYLVFINPFTTGVWTEANVGTNDAIDSDPITSVPTDPRGDAQQTAVFTLTSGQTDLTWDAGLVGLSSTASAAVGDRVWFDLNRNGIQDPGEPGRPGVTVRLYTAEGELLRTTTTNDQGIYAFTSLNPGAYFIEFVPPLDFTVTTPNAGTNDEVDSDADPTTGRTAVFTLDDFVTDLRWDMGIFQTETDLEPDEEPAAPSLYLPLIRQ